jgi:hypothetical protein
MEGSAAGRPAFGSDSLRPPTSARGGNDGVWRSPYRAAPCARRRSPRALLRCALRRDVARPAVSAVSPRPDRIHPCILSALSLRRSRNRSHLAPDRSRTSLLIAPATPGHTRCPGPDRPIWKGMSFRRPTTMPGTAASLLSPSSASSSVDGCSCPRATVGNPTRRYA